MAQHEPASMPKKRLLRQVESPFFVVSVRDVAVVKIKCYFRRSADI
jgi:hypothetical protein